MTVFRTLYNQVTVKQGLLLSGGFAAAALLAALTAQYGFSLHPCDLCIYQRYPYLAIVLLAGLAFFLKNPGLQRGALWICVLLFLLDAGIAGYHTAVEYGWVTGPSACSSSDSGNMTLEEMRAAIMNAPLVSCSQAMAYFFGLSMAAWNAIAASVMALVIFLVLRKTA
jgi:disulfide bond formation protein DsbB